MVKPLLVSKEQLQNNWTAKDTLFEELEAQSFLVFEFRGQKIGLSWEFKAKIKWNSSQDEII